MKFDRVVCISMARRPDRWKRFLDSLPADWPFGEVERFPAVDGHKCPPPSWFSGGRGSWGCLKSHINILEQCQNNDVESCLILEDDAVCCDRFRTKYEQFVQELPLNWEMFYLGGQHLYALLHPPIPISRLVYFPHNVNRTHAYAVRGRRMLQALYIQLSSINKGNDPQHVDHQLGRLHQQRKYRIYCPSEWLIGQCAGRSDLSGRSLPTRFFPPAHFFSNPDYRVNILRTILGE